MKRTNLITMVRGNVRRVFKDNDGNLYYKFAGCWHGTFIEYCIEE